MDDWYRVLHQCPACNKMNFLPIRNKKALDFTCPSCGMAEVKPLDYPAVKPQFYTANEGLWIGIVVGALTHGIVKASTGIGGLIPALVCLGIPPLVLMKIIPAREIVLVGSERVKSKADQVPS